MPQSHQPTELSQPVHFTRLRNFARSAAHYRAAVLEPRESSAPMRLGSACHAVILSQPYVVWTGGIRRGRQWEDFQAANENTGLILTEGEYETAMRCADAIGAKPDATRLLVGEKEVFRTWNVLGRPAAGTIDNIGAGFITELKTTSNAHPETFHRGGMRLAYHAQLAWYLDGLGRPDDEAYCVAVETAAPFAVTIFQLTRRALDDGRRLARVWMEQLLQCEAAGCWPDYCQSVVPFDLPDDDATTLIIDGEEVAA